MTRAPPVLLLSLTTLSSCTAPALDDFLKHHGPGGDDETSSSSTTGGGLPTTTGWDPVMTTTPAADSTDTSASTSADPDTTGTTGAPLAPQIVGHILAPTLLEVAGPVTVSIATEHAVGVRMTIDAEDPVALEPLAADTYAGEVVFASSLANGTHTARFVAWREGLESPPLDLAFAVALPAGGTEAFWESAALIGKGTIAALAGTADGEVVEFGTYYPANQPRCYLRRRDLGGAWSDDDFVVVLPDVTCSAVDMKISPTGEIFTLAHRTDNGDTRWTLARQATLAGPLEHVGQGATGEEAHALAIHPEMVAVCGTQPQPTLDLDAFVAVFRPMLPGVIKTFDYKKPGVLAHRFDETARDCVFVGDALALVGEAFGPNDGEGLPFRDRLFVLELDAKTLDPSWTVAPPGPGSQSGATAVALDDEGRLLLAGYDCDAPCEAEGALRLFTPGAGLGWHVSLGPDVQTPFDVAWHPGGYGVVVGAFADSPATTVFWAQAWVPGDNLPLWTAEHTDAPSLQIAMAVAVGAYGHVFVGGVGALGYPAIAYLNG